MPPGRWSAGSRSGLMPYLCSRDDVPGPTAHIRGPASARRSCAPATTRLMNDSTALALVKTIQSNVAGLRRAAFERPRIRRRRDAEHRRLDGLGADRSSSSTSSPRLLARARHQHAPAEQRTVRRTSAGDRGARPPRRRRGRPAPSVALLRRARRAPPACRRWCCCAEVVPCSDERRAFVRRSARAPAATPTHAWQLPRPA